MYACMHTHTHTYVQLITAETDTSTFMRPQTVVALANALRLCYALGQQYFSLLLGRHLCTKGTKTTAARESQFIREVHVGLPLRIKHANHFCLSLFKTDFMECLMMDISNFGGKLEDINTSVI